MVAATTATIMMMTTIMIMIMMTMTLAVIAAQREGKRRVNPHTESMQRRSINRRYLYGWNARHVLTGAQ